MEYPYKTKPWQHQREALRFLAKGPEGRHRKFAGLFMEQRTGKTKTTIDELSYLWLAGRVKAAIIIAPSGVHSQWVRDEIPLHMPDEVERVVIEYSSKKSRQKRWVERVRRAIHETNSDGRLLIVCMNVEALTTDNGKSLLKTVLKSRPTYMVIDESTDIKSPGAKRTKSAWARGRLAAFRRILSGFPDPEGPMDLYAQLKFLSPHIVGSTAVGFRNRYGEFEKVYYSRGKGAKPVDKLIGYKNLDELERIISDHCFRVRRDDVLDLPPKLYSKEYFEMSAEQWRMYLELEKDWETSFKDGEEVTAELSVVRQGRLQQIASGYVPTDNPDADEPIRRISGPQPRLDALKRIINANPGPMIIWCRWIMDIDLIMSELRGEAFRYDGQVGTEDRAAAKAGFQSGERRFIVANPQAASRGLTLSRSRTTVYFSQHWSLELRVQSEDRGIGEQHQQSIIDIVATDTVDEKIVRRLREKDAVARPLIGDSVREWI